eukprot:2492820-Rhodomonas_salina.3
MMLAHLAVARLRAHADHIPLLVDVVHLLAAKRRSPRARACTDGELSERERGGGLPAGTQPCGRRGPSLSRSRALPGSL